MPPKGCPIPQLEQPRKCKYCPFPPKKRIGVCNFYKGQINAGVPWHLGADRYWFEKGEYL